MTTQDNKTRPESSTISDFAKRHSLSQSTVYRLIRDGDVVITKIRGLTRISQNDEGLWLNSLQTSNKKSTR